MNSPVSLSLINQDQLSNSTADGIADIIRDLPGISVSDSGQAGLKRIRIRGQESRRIAVLIDGQESTDHREVGVPLLIDPGMVDRIEVVRGPASVLYGAKALGGVVNIITKKGGDEPIRGHLSSSYNSATKGINYLASVFGNLSGYTYRLSLSDNTQQERRTPAGSMENTHYDSNSLMFNIGRSLGNHHLELAYENYQSDAEVYVEPQVRFTLPFLDFAMDAPQRDRRKVAAFYRVEPATKFLAEVKINVYRQISDRQFNTFPSMLLFSGYSDMVIRGTLSQGYVYPSLLQLATGAYAGSRFINPNLMLEPETSETVELGLRVQTSQWIFDGTVFASQAENYIDHLLCRAADNCLTSRDEIYRNIGQSNSFGAEMAVQYLPGNSNFTPYLNVSWYRRRNEFSGLDSYKTGIPKWQGRAGLSHAKSYNGFDLRSDLFVRFESSAQELEISGTGLRESHTDHWFSVNLNVAIEFKQQYRLNLDLTNLTDRKYMPATENLWAEQRSIHLKFSLDI